MSEPILVSDIIMLTKKEVEEARLEQACIHFLNYGTPCEEIPCEEEAEAHCHLCKKLTQFVGGEDE